jgi:hypothetical protein
MGHFRLALARRVKLDQARTETLAWLRAIEYLRVRAVKRTMRLAALGVLGLYRETGFGRGLAEAVSCCPATGPPLGAAASEAPVISP